jgi:type I restriction-modification system DNA methylase subunit
MGLFSSQRVSVGQIADLAAVRPSAVSNWRSRYKDFPLPVESAPSGDLFDLGQVMAWLRGKGKDFQTPEATWEIGLRRSLETLRAGGLDVDRAVLLLCQLLYLRYCHERKVGLEPLRDSDVVDGLTKAPAAAARIWDRLLIEIGEEDAELARVLLLPLGAEKHLARAAESVARLGRTPEDWGAGVTSLLRSYQDDLGARGVAATPESLTRLLIAVLQPISGTVYDPASGLSMVLAEAWRHKRRRRVNLVGQEVNEHAWRLGYLHLALCGAKFDLKTGDTLRDDRFRTLRANRVAADPPFGMKAPPMELSTDERWTVAAPTPSADWLWAQHLLHHLENGGLGAMTVAVEALSRRGNEEEIRRNIIASRSLDAVIELPPGLFQGSSASGALLLFAQERRNRRDEILFIDARQVGTPKRGKLHELADNDVHRIAAVVEGWRQGSFEPEARFSASAPIPIIIEDGADLSPRRQVAYSTGVSEIDGEPLGERHSRLLASLRDHIHAESIVTEILDAAGAFTSDRMVEWPLVRIGDVLLDKPRTGSRHDPKGDGPEIPYILSRLVSGGSGRLVKLPKEVTRGKTTGRAVARGDVLLASRGIDAESRITCAVVDFDGEAAYAESLMRLSPRPDTMEPDYLRLFLTSRQGRTALAAATTGSVIANLRAEALMEIKMPLPDLASQRAIVASMRRIENSLTELQRLFAAARHVHDTLREGIVSGHFAPSEPRSVRPDDPSLDQNGRD